MALLDTIQGSSRDVASKNLGRIIGFLLIIQLAGLIVPFAMLHPVAPSKFIAQAAGASDQILIATLLLLANCGLAVGISGLVWRKLPNTSPHGALLIAVGVGMFCLQAVDNAHIGAMVALSRQTTQGMEWDGPSEVVAPTVAPARTGIHYVVLLAIDAWIFLFYFALGRFRLIPQRFAGFGLGTVLLHFGAITLPLLVGFPAQMTLGAAMALGHLAIASCLIAKGFPEDALNGGSV